MKNLPIPLLTFLAAQVGAAVWWGAQIDAKVKQEDVYTLTGIYQQRNTMDIQKVASTGTAVAVLGGGTFMGGNYALDQATGGPEKRIKAKQSELQLIVREEVRSALAEMLPKSTGGVMRVDQPGNYREQIPQK